MANDMAAHMPTTTLNAAPPGHGMSVMVSVDFGSSGTSIGVTFAVAQVFGNPTVHLKHHLEAIGVIGAGEFLKDPTTLLIKANDPLLPVVDWGMAVDATMETKLESDGLQDTYWLFDDVKRSLDPSVRANSDFMTWEIAPTVTVGPKLPYDRLKVVVVLQKVFEQIKQRVMEYAASRISITESQLFWVCTAPATWDDPAKCLLRSAAWKAGCSQTVTDRSFVIVSEAECAAMYGLFGGDAAPVNKDECLMIVDCGNSSTSVNVMRVESSSPVVLSQVIKPVCVPFASRVADEAVFAFLNSLFDRHLNTLVPPLQQRLLNHAWEQSKRSLSQSVQYLSFNHLLACDAISSSDPTFTKQILTDQVTRYNNNITDVTKRLLLTKSGLRVPMALVTDLYSPCIEQIKRSVNQAMDECAAANIRVSALLIAGGFSHCAALRDEIIKIAESRGIRYISPAMPRAVVPIGAALYATQSRPLAIRKMTMSYGYLAAEPFDPTVHDEKHKITLPSGFSLCNVVYPLVHRDEQLYLPVKRVITGFRCMDPSKPLLFDVFRTGEKIIEPGESRTGPPRSVLVDDGVTGGMNVGVPVSSHLLTIARPVPSVSADIGVDTDVSDGSFEAEFTTEGINITARRPGCAPVSTLVEY